MLEGFFIYRMDAGLLIYKRTKNDIKYFCFELEEFEDFLRKYKGKKKVNWEYLLLNGH